MNALLIVVLMVALAFYAIHTNPIRPDGVNPSTQEAITFAPSTVPKYTEALPRPELQLIAPVAQQSTHAISPDEAPRQTEATEELPSQQNEPPNITEPQPQPANDVGNEEGFNPRLGQQLRVTSDTSIRNGPSSSAELLGTARMGAKLRVKSRDSGWVQFVDPSANQSGWISLADLGPADRVIEDQSIVRTRPKQPPKMVKLSPKPLLKPKQSFPKPKVKPLSPTYAQLPSGPEFAPPGRRGLLGLFWNRRSSME
jgi:hypothetical protein